MKCTGSVHVARLIILFHGQGVPIPSSTENLEIFDLARLAEDSSWVVSGMFQSQIGPSGKPFSCDFLAGPVGTANFQGNFR